MHYRISDSRNWPQEQVDRIIRGDALEALSKLPDNCIALAVTSPPYWNVVDYGIEGQLGQTSYEVYLEQLTEVWRETERVLIGNGKLAIVTPVMPIPKSQIDSQHTRHLKNIAFDIEARILRDVPTLHRYSLFVWKKQTTTKMFGSYPYPPNIYEDNTIEFINVYVKDGAPPPIPKAAKEPSRLTQEEWRNLSMQILAHVSGGCEEDWRPPCSLSDSSPTTAHSDVLVPRSARCGFRWRHRSGHVQWIGSDNSRRQDDRKALDRNRPQPRLLYARRD